MCYLHQLSTKHTHEQQGLPTPRVQTQCRGRQTASLWPTCVTLFDLVIQWVFLCRCELSAYLLWIKWVWEKKNHFAEIRQLDLLPASMTHFWETLQGFAPSTAAATTSNSWAGCYYTDACWPHIAMMRHFQIWTLVVKVVSGNSPSLSWIFLVSALLYCLLQGLCSFQFCTTVKAVVYF